MAATNKRNRDDRRTRPELGVMAALSLRDTVSGLVAGMAHILDVGTTIAPPVQPLLRLGDFSDDAAALAGDWSAVGWDIRSAMDTVAADEQERHPQTLDTNN